MDNKRAIEVLQAMIKGSTGYTAVEREDALDIAVAAMDADYAIESIRQHASAQQHERRWWATYNAALSGFCSWRGMLIHEVDSMARTQANAAHGELVQP